MLKFYSSDWHAKSIIYDDVNMMCNCLVSMNLVLCSLVDTLFDQRFVDESLMSYSISPSRSQFKVIFQKLLEIVAINIGEHSLNKVSLAWQCLQSRMLEL